MAETSKIDGPVERCRPSMGVGTPEQPPGEPTITHRIDPAAHIAVPLVRQMARESILVLSRDQAKSLCRLFGVSYHEIAFVLKLLVVEFEDMHASAQLPVG